LQDSRPFGLKDFIRLFTAKKACITVLKHGKLNSFRIISSQMVDFERDFCLFFEFWNPIFDFCVFILNFFPLLLLFNGFESYN
jgi:hypothetical protein